MTTILASTDPPAGAAESAMDSPIFILTNAERDELARLVRRTARVEPALVDDPGWQASARSASCALPARLSATLRAYRHDAWLEGVLVLGNLPLDGKLLPPTPTVPESVERDATGPSTLAVLLASELGSIVAFRDEKDGALVQNVVPVPALAGSQSNGGSVYLRMHTENAFHPHRPDYVGLLCLRSAHDGNTGTVVASIRRALPLLDDANRRVLGEARFLTEAPPSFRASNGSSPLPVLDGAPEDPDICVDFNTTRGCDPPAVRALDDLREALTSVRCEVALEPGEMVLVDNRITVHGRVAFTPRYDGNDRWLHRVYVHADHRRSRRHRPGNGAVLL